MGQFDEWGVIAIADVFGDGAICGRSRPVSVRDRLAAVFAPDVVATLEAFVLEIVAERARTEEAGSPWMSVEEAAHYLRISSRTLERRVHSGRVRSTTVGRRRLLHREDLDELAKTATGEDVAPTTSPRRRRS